MFLDIISGKLPKDWNKELNKLKEQAVKDQTSVASRKASQMCLESIMPHLPQLVGGSADLAGPNMVLTKTSKNILADDE